MRTDLQPGSRSTGLVDVLDRILDKGLVIAGDIKVSLAEVELLTIRIRLIVCSLDKAQEIGLDWWRYDHHLAPGNQSVTAENARLRDQIKVLENRLASLSRGQELRRRGTASPRRGRGRLTDAR
jgi:hypothetical protein